MVRISALLMSMLLMGWIGISQGQESLTVSRLPLSHSEMHTLEAAHRAREAREGRLGHPDVLTAADLHPDTPIMLAELDDEIPAFIVERQLVDQQQQEQDTQAQMEAQPEHAAMAEENEAEMDGAAFEVEAESEVDDENAMVETEFEASQFGGYGGGLGGYGGGFGKKGGIGFKKVPYKKVPYKKVPLKKGKKIPKKPKKPKIPKKTKKTNLSKEKRRFWWFWWFWLWWLWWLWRTWRPPLDRPLPACSAGKEEMKSCFCSFAFISPLFAFPFLFFPHSLFLTFLTDSCINSSLLSKCSSI